MKKDKAIKLVYVYKYIYIKGPAAREMEEEAVGEFLREAELIACWMCHQIQLSIMSDSFFSLLLGTACTEDTRNRYKKRIRPLHFIETLSLSLSASPRVLPISSEGLKQPSFGSRTTCC